MKLIKRGIPESDKVVQWKCTGCNSIYQAIKSEGRYFSDQRDGDCVIFKCPNCKTENWVSVNLFK